MRVILSMGCRPSKSPLPPNGGVRPSAPVPPDSTKETLTANTDLPVLNSPATTHSDGDNKNNSNGWNCKKASKTQENSEDGDQPKSMQPIASSRHNGNHRGITASQTDFFRMLDDKIEQGPDYTPSEDGIDAIRTLKEF